MGDCVLAFMYICLSSAGLQTAEYEQHYGLEVRANYADVTLRVIAPDLVYTLDTYIEDFACSDQLCVTYHQWCEPDLSYCEYTLQRHGPVEMIVIQATSKHGPLLSDWRQRVGIRSQGSDTEVRLEEMTRISRTRDPAVVRRPREQTD